VTTTPLQALSLLNNSFALRMADRFAMRVRMESGDDPNQQLESIFQHAYGRLPAEAEKQPCTDLIRAHGITAMCRVVLNSNELLYVD
jgi:hypothetical protein